MNELDKAHLHNRLTELYEQRLKEFPNTDDEDLGMETGYVTDSSLNSRKGKEILHTTTFDSYFGVYLT